MSDSFGYGMFFYTVAALAAAGYFAYSAVQGDLGVLQRLEIQAEIADLERERDALAADVSATRGLVRRLSDDYLDLELLDERAREVLGVVRSDEVIIR